MWVTPENISSVSTTIFWTTLKKEWLLELQKIKESGNDVVDGLFSKLFSLSPVKQFSFLKYRIVVTKPNTQTTFVLAVSDSIEKIEEHWHRLTQEFLPQIIDNKV